jgi:hypothetical protein
MIQLPLSAGKGEDFVDIRRAKCIFSNFLLVKLFAAQFDVQYCLDFLLYSAATQSSPQFGI